MTLACLLCRVEVTQMTLPEWISHCERVHARISVVVEVLKSMEISRR